jgi:hypothetical protein
MTAQYTPGPWEWSKNGNITAKGAKIAYTLLEPENANHNTRLIAASPMLHEACSITLRTIGDTLRHVNMSEGCEEALEICCKDLRAAIAAAEGGSHD